MVFLSIGAVNALVVDTDLLLYQTAFSENEKKIINLINDQDVTVNLFLKTSPYPGLAEKYSAVKWVQYNEDHFELGPAQRFPLGVFLFTPEYVLGTHAAQLQIVAKDPSENILSTHVIKLIHVASGAQRIIKVADVKHVLKGDQYLIDLKINNEGESWVVLSGFASIIREDAIVSGKMKLPETSLMPGDKISVKFSIPITYALTERGNKLKVYFLMNGTEEQFFEQFLVKDDLKKTQAEISIPKNDPLEMIPTLNFKLLAGTYKYQNKKVKAFLRISNYADLAITPTVYVSVLDGRGRKIIEWTVPVKTIRAGYEELLSGSSAMVSLKPGQYSVKVKMLFQKQEVEATGNLVIN